MNGRDLSNRLLYTGMIRDARKLAFKDKMATAEELALMSELEICDLIEQDYNIITVSYTHLTLPTNSRV